MRIVVFGKEIVNSVDQDWLAKPSLKLSVSIKTYLILKFT